MTSERDLHPESGTPVTLMAMPETSEMLPETPMTDIAMVLPDPDPADVEPPDFGPPHVEAAIELQKGDTVARVLDRLGIEAADIAEIVEVLAERVRLDRLPIGQALIVKLQRLHEAEKPTVLVGLSIRPEPQRAFNVERDDDGGYSLEEEVFEVAPKVMRASGEVDGSVIASVEAAGVPHGPLAEMLRAFSWDVNFQHDIKPGDRFDVLVERSWTIDGRPADDGRVLWAEITTGGGAETYSIYRFKPRDGEEFFYNPEGESVVKALLRTPLNMSRISSRFGLRHHPVLKFTRLHSGVDFAAPPGTPILAAGAGHVIEAGRFGGYGNWVKIGHDGGLATGYAHMSRIAPGMKRSARVRQGQVIGYVGSTGLSTGPHLHFELHRGGRPIDPLTMARTAQRTRLAGKDLERFKAQVAETDRVRETAASLRGEETN
ncbi:MAG: M23 family peptidase [Reyranella sp.]|uniref:M23 family metallopeptidase n=1 Tax=Reyranella sp. TaxID=1929291 RepID=UPI0011F47F74|nr:peptidoglycan DD-metalloendopeptidase family protein [Reyranella sp.]TAJ85006.1 MAG: M23 family peptidase [Reyranella sp.]